MNANAAPTVSVVMPVFSHSEKQLLAAVHSILNQTFQDFEFIIADGRADERNSLILAAVNDSRIRYLKAKGYVNCLNAGVALAKGKYVARMDSDDVSFPTRLDEQVRYMEENPDVALSSCLVEFYGDCPETLKVSKHTVITDCVLDFIRKCDFVHPAMIFRRDLNLRYDDIKPAEDCLLFRKLLLNGRKLAVLDKVLLKSYVSKNSIMARHPALVDYYMSEINIFAVARYFDLDLSFLDGIFTKRKLSNKEAVEFLNFTRRMKKKLKGRDLNAAALAYPYFARMLSKMKNKRVAATSAAFYQTFFPFVAAKYGKPFVQRVFSVRNEYGIDADGKRRKHKIMRVLGLKFRADFLKKRRRG